MEILMYRTNWDDLTGKEQYVQILKDEVEELKTRLREHDTGHILTTINVIQDRIAELQLPQWHVHIYEGENDNSIESFNNYGDVITYLMKKQFARQIKIVRK